MTPATLATIRAHAEQELPRECCGLVSVVKGKEVYTPCPNIATGNDHFVIDPQAYAEVEEAGTILYIVHSHCYIPAVPSQSDLVGCELTGLPWLIYSVPTHQTCLFEPTGYKAPLEGREFNHGTLDCYSLIRDYYQERLAVTIPDYPRDVEWWLHGGNLYLEHFAAAGFVSVSKETMRTHDVVLMQIASPVPNHAGVYVGDGLVLQHLANRLSSKDVYGGWFAKLTTHVLRHNSLC